MTVRPANRFSRAGIVPRSAHAYLTAMASALFRLLALIALLAMPGGMAGAPALAAPAPAASGHCEQGHAPAEAPAQPQAHCAACAALPAFELPAPAATVVPTAPRLIARTQAIDSIEPEIATPPPKLS